MHSIGSPEYVYRPWSEERREQMINVHLNRLGIPSGHRRLYGIILKKPIAQALCMMVRDIARIDGPQVAAKKAAEWQDLTLAEAQNLASDYFAKIQEDRSTRYQEAFVKKQALRTMELRRAERRLRRDDLLKEIVERRDQIEQKRAEISEQKLMARLERQAALLKRLEIAKKQAGTSRKKIAKITWSNELNEAAEDIRAEAMARLEGG